jgi:hypothetical protein
VENRQNGHQNPPKSIKISVRPSFLHETTPAPTFSIRFTIRLWPQLLRHNTHPVPISAVNSTSTPSDNLASPLSHLRYPISPVRVSFMLKSRPSFSQCFLQVQLKSVYYTDQALAPSASSGGSEPAHFADSTLDACNVPFSVQPGKLYVIFSLFSSVSITIADRTFV